MPLAEEPRDKDGVGACEGVVADFHLRIDFLTTLFLWLSGSGGEGVGVGWEAGAEADRGGDGGREGRVR